MGTYSDRHARDDDANDRWQVHVTVQPATSPPTVSLIKVTTPSGQTIEVMGPGEQAFYEGQRDRYRAENAFTAASDLLDMDRLLFMELLVYRSTTWLAAGKDYYGDELAPSQEAAERRSLKENSTLISVIKNDLGLTKAQRDKAQYESVGTYITTLRARAREFGIHREKQLGKALQLINELFAIVGAFDRADEVERAKLGFEDEAEILDWIRTVMRPEFERIDSHFREHQQRTWIREI